MVLEFDSSTWTGNGPNYDKIVYSGDAVDKAIIEGLLGTAGVAGLIALYNTLSNPPASYWQAPLLGLGITVGALLHSSKTVPHGPKP